MASGFGHPASATTRTTSFNVTATVAATCRIAPALKAGSTPSPLICQPPIGAPRTIVAPPPRVMVARDPKTGALVQTIEF
jgi:hypothetical protein